jgi:uncharacterized oxidoreductase
VLPKRFFHSFTLSLRRLLEDKAIEVIEVIPPALNTDLGGKGIHDMWDSVDTFIDSIFAQLKDGSINVSHGFSIAMSNAGKETLEGIFNQVNPRE